MNDKPVYKLTNAEWREHRTHRRGCEDHLCDHYAHHYARAFADGRVQVDGVTVDEDGLPLADDDEVLAAALRDADPYRDVDIPPAQATALQLRERAALADGQFGRH